MGSLIVITLIVIAVALVPAFIWAIAREARIRTESLGKVAAELGMEFSATQDEAILEKLQDLPLFNLGHNCAMSNVMSAETDFADLAVFDYSFSTGSGQHTQNSSHTVFAMISETLSLPVFSLRPEKLSDKIKELLGSQDIDFDDHPKFSKSYVLQGENEEAIRSFFDYQLLEIFAQRKGVFLESAPGVFMCLLPQHVMTQDLTRGAQKKPEQIRELMEEGHLLYAAFADRLARQTSEDSSSE